MANELGQPPNKGTNLDSHGDRHVSDMPNAAVHSPLSLIPVANQTHRIWWHSRAASGRPILRCSSDESPIHPMAVQSAPSTRWVSNPGLPGDPQSRAMGVQSRNGCPIQDPNPGLPSNPGLPTRWVSNPAYRQSGKSRQSNPGIQSRDVIQGNPGTHPIQGSQSRDEWTAALGAADTCCHRSRCRRGMELPHCAVHCSLIAHAVSRIWTSAACVSNSRTHSPTQRVVISRPTHRARSNAAAIRGLFLRSACCC